MNKCDKRLDTIPVLNAAQRKKSIISAVSEGHKTMAQIAREHGVSREYVRQLKVGPRKPKRTKRSKILSLHTEHKIRHDRQRLMYLRNEIARLELLAAEYRREATHYTLAKLAKKHNVAITTIWKLCI
jgi:transposase-like protein